MIFGFSYWRAKKNEEVDIIAQVGGRTVLFEIKYRHQHTGAGKIKGLTGFCTQKRIARGYVITAI
jgi:predicted AAA+ superfamily ATPase